MSDIGGPIPKRVLYQRVAGFIRQSIRLVWLLLAPFLHRGNRWTRKAERRQDLAFWLARDKIRDVWFKVLSVTFKQKYSFRESPVTTVALRKIPRVILFPVFLSCGFVVFFVWLDQSVFPALLSYLDNTVSGVFPDLIAEPTLNWARATANNESFEGAHTTLLATGAQVTGVFLGLYFTTISVVASMAYGDVPPELRSVLIEDQVGGLYLCVVSFTGGACLFGLGTQALGYSLGSISAVIFASLGAASILVFVPLGRRVFGFLNPETVTSALKNDIERAVKSVAALGILARNQSIQAQHQEFASLKLDVWEEMVFVSSGRSHSSSALRVIGRNAALFLHRYSGTKLSIARTSQWFERVPKHPSYLVTESTRLSMALQTGTWIRPEMEPDLLWLEKRIGEIVQRVVVALGKEGGNRPSVEVLDPFYDWIARSAHQFRVPEMEMGFQIASRIEHTIRSPSAETNEMTDRDRLHGLEVLDGLARAIPSAAGLLNQSLGTLRLDQLLNDASNAATSESRSLEGFPPRLRTIIESLRSKHSFERDVEASIQTPTWYIQHHAARFLSIDIKTTFESLLDRTEQWLPSQAKSLREEGATEAAVMVIQRGLEAVSKLEVGAEETSNKLEDLKQWRRETAVGQEWPSINLEQWHERLRKLRLTLINELAHLTPLLATTPPTGDLPDGFGLAYTTLCDAMIEALENMDTATFELIYPVVVRTALKAHDRVKAELVENSAEDVMYFSIDIMVDMMDISGYAYLWKFGLGEDRFWDSVKDVWDIVLSERTPLSNLAKVITFVLGQDYHRQRFAPSPRSEIRWQWKIRIQQVLEGKGFALRGISSNRRAKVIAINPTVSAYFADWNEHKPRDLILSKYFLKRAEAEDLPVPRNVEELRRKAKRLLDDRADGTIEDDPEFFGGLR